MVMPGMPQMPVYTPKWPAVVELNIGDLWRARWVDEPELAANAPVAHAYAVVVMGEKGYLARPQGNGPWGTVEGAPNSGEAPAAFVKRAALEQIGAVAGRVELIGYFECKATSHNPGYPVGAMTVRPLYLVVAKQVKERATGAGWERRRAPLNEHAAALRNRYPELEAHMAKAVNRYQVLLARGEA